MGNESDVAYNLNISNTNITYQWGCPVYSCNQICVYYMQTEPYSVKPSYQDYWESESEKLHSVCQVKDVLLKTVYFTSTALGVPANCLALVAMMTLRPRSVAGMFVAMLAAADLLSLVIRFIDYLIVVYEPDYNRFVCGFKNTSLMLFPTFSNWMLVLICLERFYTLRFPLSRAAHFTFGRARMMAGGLALVLFAYFLPRTFLNGEVHSGVCLYTSDAVKNFFMRGDEILYYYIPVVLIFSFVGLIAWELHKAQKTRAEMFRNSLQKRETSENSSHGASEAEGSREGSAVRFCTTDSSSTQNEQTKRFLKQQVKNERALTIMMLAAAIFFFVMNLPICIMLRLQKYEVIGVEEEQQSIRLEMARALSVFPHVANFFIYFLTCRRLRSHLCQMIMCSRKKGRCLCCQCCPRVCASCPCCREDRRLCKGATPEPEDTRTTKIALTHFSSTDA